MPKSSVAPTPDLGSARHGARSELVYMELREAIRTLRLKPGDRILETEIADRLKVSRTPVRDAIRRLESDGILMHEARGGLVVAKLDERAVIELYAIREVLEGTAARLCARHASDMEIMALAELVKREQQLQGDYAALAVHNQRFHEAIRNAAHNRFLLKSLNAVNDSMGLLGRSQMLIPQRAKTALAEHTDIVRAIQKRDPDAAEAANRKHVVAAQRERVKHMFQVEPLVPDASGKSRSQKRS
jgi:DNA-binding GntR family transcriptional regulator